MSGLDRRRRPALVGGRLGNTGPRIFLTDLECGGTHQVTTVTGFSPHSTDSILCTGEHHEPDTDFEPGAPHFARIVSEWTEQPKPKPQEATR